MKDLLHHLESESIEILREVYAQFERPMVLYSVGKDSSVLLHLIRKAFFPLPFPFPLLHVDTGYKFKDMYDFRDQTALGLGAKLIIHRNEDAISRKVSPQRDGTLSCCAQLKTAALLQALTLHRVDAAIGGARRDEERSRAKERIFSFRDRLGQWEPRNQRPELWHLYNGKIRPEESIRVFPLSNWTERDIWHYIAQEEIPVVPLYFAQTSPPDTTGNCSSFRYRSLGCTHCTGSIASQASSVREILEELEHLSVSERSNRRIDHDTDGSMELKKREGYF